MATSVYKNDFYNADDKTKKNLRVPKCNYEIEANRIFSDVKNKNKFVSDVMTTTHTDYKKTLGQHKIYGELTKPEIKTTLEEKRNLIFDKDLAEIGKV